MKFQKITLENIDELRTFLYKEGEFSCELSPVNLLVWGALYKNEYCIEDDILFLKSGAGENLSFSMPFGDIKKGMEKLTEFCGGLPKIWAQQGARFKEFISLYEKNYCVKTARDGFDYIYKSERLITLSGKKLHSKRNHISAFTKSHEWCYEDINEENIPDVLECADRWYTENNHRIDKKMETERSGIEFMLKNIKQLGILGGAIRVKGKIVAFTLGSPINNNVFDIHIEKALGDYSTAYTVINREFAAHNLKEYEYINREDDLGLEGLRKAKLSYHPDILLEKYDCKPKGVLL